MASIAQALLQVRLSAWHLHFQWIAFWHGMQDIDTDQSRKFIFLIDWVPLE